MPGLGLRQGAGDGAADVEQVLARVWREGDRSHQAVRLPLGLVVALPFALGSA